MCHLGRHKRNGISNHGIFHCHQKEINKTLGAVWSVKKQTSVHRTYQVYYLTVVVNTSINVRRNMTVPKSNNRLYSTLPVSFDIHLKFIYRLPMYKCGSGQNKAQTLIYSNSLTTPSMQPLILESRQEPRSTCITVSTKGRKSTPKYTGGGSPILSGDFLAIWVIQGGFARKSRRRS